MKYEVIRFKSLRLALNEIAQFIREPLFELRGKPGFGELIVAEAADHALQTFGADAVL